MIRQGARFLAGEHIRRKPCYVRSSFDHQMSAHEGMVDADRMPTQSPEARSIEGRTELPSGIDEPANAITAFAWRIFWVRVKVPYDHERTILHFLRRLNYPVPASPLGLQISAVVRQPNSENLETVLR